MPQPANKTNDGFRDLPIETRESALTVVRTEGRVIEVVWTTGARVDRYDWISDQRYEEELVVSDKAVRLGLLSNGGPVLDNHRRDGVSSILACVDRAWINDGLGYATVRFQPEGEDADVDKVFRKVAGGQVNKISVGYRRLKIEVDKSKSPHLWRVVDWEPFEISFVIFPADQGARVRSADDLKFRCEFRVLPAESEARLARMRMRQRIAGF